MTVALHRLARIALAFLVSGLTFYGLTRVAGGEPPPPGPPGPVPTPSSSGDYPVISGTDIPLWEPLADPTEIPIAGYWFLVPAGATATEVFEGPPLAGQGQIPHERYWSIERDTSRARVDSETGEVYSWDVQPEDQADFEALLAPRPE